MSFERGELQIPEPEKKLVDCQISDLGDVETADPDVERFWLELGAVTARTFLRCLILTEENADQVQDFLGRHADFALLPPAEVAAALGERAFLFRRAALMLPAGVLMTPRRTDTDGFFVAVMVRR